MVVVEYETGRPASRLLTCCRCREELCFRAQRVGRVSQSARLRPNVPFVVGVVAEAAAAAVRLLARVDRQVLPVADEARVRQLCLVANLYACGPAAALCERTAADGADVRVHHLRQFGAVQLALRRGWIRIRVRSKSHVCFSRRWFEIHFYGRRRRW